MKFRKCIVFDLDDTLWSWGPNARLDARDRHHDELLVAMTLIRHQCRFLAVAKRLVQQMYPGIFDIVIGAASESDKVSMFAKIRRAYKKQYGEKLKWKEMAFFDNDEENIVRLEETGVKVFQLNEKTGLTRRQLIRCLELEI